MNKSSSFVFRTPTAEDAIPVNRMIAASPPLDTNSVYCNLLQCSHFSETCILAEHQGKPAGFISAYRLPNAPHCLFVWQAVVAESARGQGLASRMLAELLARPSLKDITRIETTITEDNKASWALFRKMAGQLGGKLTHQMHFDRKQHFDDQHDSEILVQITDFSI